MARIDNNYFTYRETPTTENGTGTLVDIKGKTLKWNQLASVVGEQTNTVGLFDTNTYVYSGHKYLMTVEANPSSTNTMYLSVYYNDGSNRQYGQVTGTSSGKYTLIFNSNYTASGGTANVLGHFWFYAYNVSSWKNLMLFDLTAMGIDTLTNAEILQWFADYFPLSYYPFNSGSLIPFNGNGIKTVGFNQWDEQTQKGYWNASNGNYVSNQSQLCSLNYIPVLPNTNYCYRKTSNVGDVIFYDANKVFISASINMRANAVFTTPSNCYYIQINLGSTYGSIYRNDICINISDTSKNGTYEPYTESVINLPISQYFPTGMKQAGTVYDELTESKAITRVGMVDLGSLTWTKWTNQYKGFYARIGDAKGSENGQTDNAECVKYKAETYSQVVNGLVDKTFNIASSTRIIYLYDSAYQDGDAETFKASLSGVYLYYELVTPIETAISPELDLTFNIDKGGTEELLPSSLMNGSVDLGSLTWTLYGANNHEFTAELPNMKVGTTNASIPSLGVNAVANYAQWTAQRPNDSLYKDSNGKLHLRLNPYTTVAELTSALQGVYLWYETTDSTPTTTPILCDILYRGLIPVSVTVYPLGAGTVEGAGQYRYGETVTLVAESSDGIYRFLRYEDENGDTLSTDSTYSFIAGE